MSEPPPITAERVRALIREKRDLVALQNDDANKLVEFATQLISKFVDGLNEFDVALCEDFVLVPLGSNYTTKAIDKAAAILRAPPYCFQVTLVGAVIPLWLCVSWRNDSNEIH